MNLGNPNPKPKEGDDGSYLWSFDSKGLCKDQICFASFRSRKLAEDFSHVVFSRKLSFFAIFEGYEGGLVARYLADNLFLNLESILAGSEISEAALTESFLMTDQNYLNFLHHCPHEEIKDLSHINVAATTGSGCLVGVVSGNKLYLANVGNARAVMSSLHEVAIMHDSVSDRQLTRDDDVQNPDALIELKEELPADAVPDDILLHQRVKGKIKLTKGMGFAYLKSKEFNMDDHQRFKLKVPIQDPVISATPMTSVRTINPDDKFIIFASSGLWNLVSNKEAVDFVNTQPRLNVATKLIEKALAKATTKTGDVTVLVIFLDKEGFFANEGFLGVGEPEFSAKGLVRDIVKLGQSI